MRTPAAKPGGLVDHADGVLLGAARDGSEAAFAVLFERHAAATLQQGRRSCERLEDAEDAFQQTMLLAWRSIRGGSSVSSVRGWLMTIIRRLCHRLMTNVRALLLPPDELALLPDPQGGPELHLNRREIACAVATAVAALEPKYRDVLVLRDIDQRPAAEVARELGISLDATKSRLHRARFRVRQRLAPPTLP